ncbi:hypothetical protein ACIBF6_10435 [Streptosporangium amethystogenes]|uniref:hypothetical protein n=1 Tax=Streptosporangium amethystogenes TaxID=2002 RepID=UPI0037916B36
MASIESVTLDVAAPTAAEPVDLADPAPETAKTGFDPRELDEPYRYFLIRPRRIQAWHEANELRGRDLIRDGHRLG